MKCSLIFAFPILWQVSLAVSHVSLAAVPKVSMIPSSDALEPEAALAAFEVAEDVRLELVASEPVVISPVAIAFDERDRLFVVEMPGFSQGQKPKGRVVLLEDMDHDGRMDKRTVYADGLTAPEGILPWKDGVIVTAAPDVLFLRDTDGDGRADGRRVLLTGFSTKGTPALRVNCPTLGPDGWIYLAAGLSGGEITVPEHSDQPPLKMISDLRFHPETLEVENVTGRSQYGMSFDAAGRRFMCMNRVPVQHVVLDAHWLQRNPNLEFSQTVQDCNDRTLRNVFRASGSGAGVKLFPISSHLVNVDSHAGSFTAACSVHIWRGGNLPETYRGSAFSCDPTANLVHVDRLVPSGATFAAEPILDGREFVASRDDWFRPVFLTSGPGGALYIADMYQKIIEHIDYLPEEVRKYADVGAGMDRGRIWKVVAKKTNATAPPTEEVALENDWLYASRPVDPTAGRLWLEERLAAASSPNPRTRFIAALALGDVQDPRALEVLASVAVRDIDDRWARAAVLSGVSGREVEVFAAAAPQMPEASEAQQDFLTVLGRGFPDLGAVESAMTVQARSEDEIGGEGNVALAMPLLLGFSESSGTTFRTSASDRWLKPVLASAIATAGNSGQPASNRIISVRLLGRMDWDKVGGVLGRMAVDEPVDSVRAEAIRSFAGFDRAEVSRTLLTSQNWSRSTPAQRGAILGALLTSDVHRVGVLDAIESRELPTSAVSGVPRRQFLNHRDAALRERAEKIWSAAPADQQQALAAARMALALEADSGRGREVFRNACVICHRLDGEGYNVGPDLADMRRQDKETILYHIVVPDAEIVPMYAAYVVETTDGSSFGGILINETPVSITLQAPLGQETVIQRSRISNLEALRQSFMPTGLETAMSQQNLADLLAYLRGEG